MKIVTQTPTLDTNAYSAGDAVGGLLTFDLGYVGSRPHVLKLAEILDDSATPDSAELELHLFTDSAMAVADDAAFSVSQANILAGKYIGKIPFTEYNATLAGTNAAAVLASVPVDWEIRPIRGKVYGQLVCVGTPTFDATQLHAILHFEKR